MKGGAERYVLDLSAWLELQGHDVIPFAMQHPDNFPSQYSEFFPSFMQTESVRFPRDFSPVGLRTFVQMFYSSEAKRKMSQLIEATGPDIAHIHNIYTQLSPSILDALHDRRIPTIMTVHDHHLISPQYNIWAEGCGPDYSRIGLMRGTLSKFHKNSYAATFAQIAAFKYHYHRGSYRNRVNLFLTPSDYMRGKLVAGGFPEEKIRVVPYGADPATVTARFDHDGYVLYFGRLSEEKGVETVIQVAKRLVDVLFKIVGTGPQEAKLHALAHGSPNIEFIGFQNGEALQELIRGATCVLVPSRVHENFPLSALEALAVGKPVIASRVGGVPEVVEDRVTGLLVPPLDLHAWVEAVMRLVYDEDLRIRLARAARLSVETTFHIHAHQTKVMKAYEDVLSS